VKHKKGCNQGKSRTFIKVWVSTKLNPLQDWKSLMLPSLPFRHRSSQHPKHLNPLIAHQNSIVSTWNWDPSNTLEPFRNVEKIALNTSISNNCPLQLPHCHAALYNLTTVDSRLQQQKSAKYAWRQAHWRISSLFAYLRIRQKDVTIHRGEEGSIRDVNHEMDAEHSDDIDCRRFCT